MTIFGRRRPPSAPATRLEPATAPRRSRDDSPYAPHHAAFSPRRARGPPLLAPDGAHAVGTNSVPTPPTPVAAHEGGPSSSTFGRVHGPRALGDPTMPGDGGERESRLRVYVGEDLSAPRRGADGLCVRRPMRPALTSRPFGVVEAAPCFVAGSTAPHGFPSSRLTSQPGVTCSSLSVVIGDVAS